MRIWKATIAAKSAAAYVEVALPFVIRTLSLPGYYFLMAKTEKKHEYEPKQKWFWDCCSI